MNRSLTPATLTLSLLLFCTTGVADLTVLECRRLVDVETGKVLDQRQILIEDRRIVAVRSADDGGVDAPADARRSAASTGRPAASPAARYSCRSRVGSPSSRSVAGSQR